MGQTRLLATVTTSLNQLTDCPGLWTNSKDPRIIWSWRIVLLLLEKIQCAPCSFQRQSVLATVSSFKLKTRETRNTSFPHTHTRKEKKTNRETNGKRRRKTKTCKGSLKTNFHHPSVNPVEQLKYQSGKSQSSSWKPRKFSFTSRRNQYPRGSRQRC